MKANFLSSPLFVVSLIGTILLAVPLVIAPYQMAQATTTEPDRTRMVWTTTRSLTAQRDLANSVLSLPNDYIVLHLGQGQDITQAMIDALKGVTAISDNRKGFEFFSLAEMEEWAPTIYANGFRLVYYDLESGPSPAEEVADPVAAFTEARQIVLLDNNLNLGASPSRAITNDHAAQIATKVTFYHMQIQALQTADSTCETLKDEVEDNVAAIEAASSTKEGKISYQLSYARPPASGDPDSDTTIKRCMDLVSPGDVDMLSLWWNAASWDSGQYQNRLAYYESTYS
jgi:hypothetical protein